MEKEKEFKYDPEEQDKNKFVRLPFGLCKSHGIKIQDWWTPKDAWDALQRGGIVRDVDEEYKKHIKELKKQQAKESKERNKAREHTKKMQLASPKHTPDKEFKKDKNYVANAKKGKPMTFEQADNGNVNPYFEDNTKGLYIGYMHNCQTCVACFKARLDGFDVHALPNLNNREIHDLSCDVTMAYIDKRTGKKPVLEKLNENAMEDGKMYAVRFSYVGKRAGHIITATKTNGKVEYYDPQTNRKYNNLSVYGRLERKQMFSLSDCELNNEFCNKIFKSNNA